MKNILITLSILLFIFSCRPKKEDTQVEEEPVAVETITEEKIPVSKAWIGEWEIRANFSSSTLAITKIVGDSIAFSLEASDGAHMGELSGMAKAHANNASFINTDYGDTCRILFELKGDSIVINQKSGTCGAGAGVYYSGNYLNTKIIKETSEDTKTLLALGIFKNEKEESAFQELVTEDYNLFFNSSQLVSEGEDLDSLQARVYESGVRGLFTIMENIIMVDKDRQIWAAVIEDDKVYYYTTHQQYINRLPKTIEKWRDRFPEKKVVYISARPQI